MKFRVFAGVCMWFSVFLISCNHDISFERTAGKLEFSKDTVFCDTVFNQVRSETYAVKVYNPQDEDVNIPRVYLAGGHASPYRINVDGKAGVDFTNVPLRAHDSLYIFVEIAPVTHTSVAIAEDQVRFKTASGEQHVTLFTVVEDADFYISTPDNPKVITQNTTWDNDKVKVIFGNLTLAQGKTLNIEEGTKVYFHKNSGLILDEGSHLIAHGDLDKPIVFRGDRNDLRYDTLPANWNSIQVLEGAEVDFNYVKLMGGTVGLQLNAAQADISNTIVHSFQGYGILAIASDITAKNLIMNSAGEASLGIFGGGNYDLIHSTITNYWPFAGGGVAQGIYASDVFEDGTQAFQNPLNLKIRNSIVYGSRSNSVVLAPENTSTFNYFIENSLLKYDESVAGFTFEANPRVVASIKNENPKFKNYHIQKMNLRVAADSPAKGKGKPSVAQQVPKDYAKVSRTLSPTLGAYQ